MAGFSSLVGLVCVAAAITAEDPWTCVNDNITTDEKLRKKIEPACAGNDLDVTYQSCTAPCCGCWKAYWPELLDLWGRCGVPASTFKGEGTVGSYKAKEDWYCGNGVWGTCVVPKWDAAQAQLTECTSGPDQSKLKEPFGLYRNRRSEAESCACLAQAYRALDSILRECQVPSWLWFKGYSQRRFTDNHCGSLDSGEAAFNVTKKWSFLGDFTSNSVVKGRKQEAFVGILPVALAAAITAEDPWTCVNDNITTDEKLRKKIEPACAGNDLDVTYQSCTAPCCGCWKAYWPELLDLWGRCGVPASTFKGEGTVGSYKAKEDWYCGNGVWGTCVVPKWDAAQAQLTECTSGPDQSKLKEPFGLYRNRRSEAESCACLAQAYRALDSILRECQVPSWLWFKGYSQRRFTDNHCGSLDSGEAAFNVTKKWSFLGDFTSNSVVKGRKQEAFVGILPVALAAAITAEDPWTCVNDNITTDEKLRKKIEPACAGNDLDVTYQSCTAPCCGCWKAYWPELLDLWGRCGVPASTFKGEGTVGSYKAKEDWYCGNGVWGTCVVPKWDAAQAQLTECTSGPDQSKLKEPFGLYRNRRSEAESCACLAQAYRALDSILRECQVPSWLWFKGYSQRRFTDNHCGSLDSGEAAFNVTKKWSFLGDFTSNSVVKGRKQEAFVGILPVALAAAITAEDPWTCVNDNITTDEKLRKKIEPACAGNDLDVTYQSCTAPCCGCWNAYWPELLDLWGRCGVPASTFKGEGTVGSYKAKDDWYCGNGVWGTCVVPKWDAAQAQLTECTSGPDQSKLKEPFGLYRNRRSEAESCACLAQAYWALDSILRECQVPSWLWFKGYSQRRFTDNHCGSLDSGEAAFNVTKKWSFLGDFTSNSLVKGRKQEAFVGILPVALAAGAVMMIGASVLVWSWREQTLPSFRRALLLADQS
ncbi:unnamed protein product [Polarella glacialis]|uniref:Uncharacterized protein n=1 Tax=Polarella glacialis TaxID=89957 RepID=A0A813J352_POLGL|nr:unnamed protein product [Polarella glacialis]